jgi:hypothetical protein
VIVGAQGVGNYAGAAYLYRGGPGGLSAKATPLLNPHSAAGTFGWSVGM